MFLFVSLAVHQIHIIACRNVFNSWGRPILILQLAAAKNYFIVTKVSTSFSSLGSLGAVVWRTVEFLDGGNVFRPYPTFRVTAKLPSCRSRRPADPVLF